MRIRARPAATLLATALAWSAHAGTTGPLHSHNDYERSRPLELALENGFESVEADIWHHDDELQVGHLPWLFHGTLRELYLIPLMFRVFENGGSVHGDGRTFLLWIEFKDSNPKSVELLRRELSEFPIFTEFSDSGIRERAVTVILTGDEANKQRFVSMPGVRLATRDSERISSSDPAATPTFGNDWLWYALDWSRYFRWRGQGALPSAERDRLRNLLAEAHLRGRKIRFFHAPDGKPFWSVAREEGLDLVGTDRVKELARFWK